MASTPISSKALFNKKLFARTRVATESDVPHIYKLMQQLMAYHNITHLLKSNENSIASGLFNPKLRQLSPVTTLLVEVSADRFPFSTDQVGSKVTSFIEPPQYCEGNDVRPSVLLGLKQIDLNLPLIDEESEEFRVNTDHHDDVFIAGYIMFYPCFSSFFEKPVFHMENFFIRECYRSKGLGKWMFSTMAFGAARMGFSSIDWYASDWNESALDFYTKMGARISDDFRVLGLAGKALEAFDDDSN